MIKTTTLLTFLLALLWSVPSMANPEKTDKEVKKTYTYHSPYSGELRLMDMSYQNNMLPARPLDITGQNMSGERLNKLGNILLYSGIAATAIGTVMMVTSDELYFNCDSGAGCDGDAKGAFGLVITMHGIAGIVTGLILKGKARRK